MKRQFVVHFSKSTHLIVVGVNFSLDWPSTGNEVTLLYCDALKSPFPDFCLLFLAISFSHFPRLESYHVAYIFWGFRVSETKDTVDGADRVWIAIERERPMSLKQMRFVPSFIRCLYGGVSVDVWFDDTIMCFWNLCVRIIGGNDLCVDCVNPL